MICLQLRQFRTIAWSQPYTPLHAIKIFDFCLKQNIELPIEWTPRILNGRANAISKLIDVDDCQLKMDFLHELDVRWGPHTRFLQEVKKFFEFLKDRRLPFTIPGDIPQVTLYLSHTLSKNQKTSCQILMAFSALTMKWAPWSSLSTGQSTCRYVVVR